MAQLDWVPILFDEIRDEDQAVEKESVSLYKRSSMLLTSYDFCYMDNDKHLYARL